MERCKICLNVAEKPSVAKGVSQILSQGKYSTTSGLSKYNPIYTFTCEIEKTICEMRFTSVLGHVKGIKFPDSLSDWNYTPFEKLYTTPIENYVVDGMQAVAKNIINASKDIDWLILWLDCDREGEGIAYEVISIHL